MYSGINSDLDILNRMLDKVPDNIDKEEGSFVHDAISPVSQELAQSYIALDNVLSRAFAITAAENGFSHELELRAAEFGIYRKDGTKAVGQVAFSGSDNVLIPAGTIVQTGGGLQFKTLSDVVIKNNTAKADIEALEIGIKYNIPAGTIIQLPTQITGVTSIINNNVTSGGTEIENDQSLLQRLLFRVQLPATSGNIYHYKQWAMEVNGVGDAVVVPLWNGPGTVKVVILDSNKKVPAKNIIDAVSAHIEKARPVGAHVTVVPAKEITINIDVKLQLIGENTLTQAKSLIERGVERYLDSIAFKESYIRYTKIANVLLDIPIIMDYSNLMLNGKTSNIAVEEGQVGILGQVNVSAA